MTAARLPEDALRHLQAREEWLWINPDRRDPPEDLPELSASVAEARDRMARAEGLVRDLFDLPDGPTPPIHSPLLPVDGFDPAVTSGRWFVKADHALPVAGSIKARGGFHEVIAHAERLAIAAGTIAPDADLRALATPDARALFADHSIVVGSTGNLGMSIGLCGAVLGFRTMIHMSTDAKEWKKQRLRDHGAEVVEHAGDYGEAVAKGRALAAADLKAHFVDDEHSVDLFCGYASAAQELSDQLSAAAIVVDADHPLIVHLPCGVGGAPGGIAYGLKRIFGADVECYFAEPVESPSMLVQLLAGVGAEISVYDIGLSNRTDLDGLACAAASPLVAPLMRQRLAGIYTVTDAHAHALLRQLHDAYGIRVEPSAATALAGPPLVGRRDATQISWTTGGSLVPEVEFRAYLSR